MGIKGSKNSQEAALTTQLITERLIVIDGVTSKKMFGGYGIFHDGKMFGIVDSNGQCYFKADDTNLPDYLGSGGHQHSKMPYYSLSDDVINDPLLLEKWARKSIAISK